MKKLPENQKEKQPVPSTPQIIEVPSLVAVSKAMTALVTVNADVVEKMTNLIAGMNQKQEQKQIRVKIIRDSRGDMSELIITKG